MALLYHVSKNFLLHSKCSCFLRLTALAATGGFNIRANNYDNKILLKKNFNCAMIPILILESFVLMSLINYYLYS